MPNELYATAVGTWGDSIAAYGNMLKELEVRKREKCKMICYSKDPEVAKFLGMQKEIEAVVHIQPEGDGEYLAAIGQIGDKAEVDWNKIANVKGEVIQTHIGNDFLFEHPDIINRPEKITLDYESYLDVPKNVLFFQPFSTHSVSLVDHWPYWFQALEWLDDRGGWEIWVFGLKRGGMRGQGFEFPRLCHLKNVNSFVDRACMMAVLQIAKKCKGIITTSNCIAMWSVIHKKKSLVMCNKLNLTHDYYNGWINHPPNTLLPANTTLDKFKRDFQAWEATL